jgi:hypothetical protein
MTTPERPGQQAPDAPVTPGWFGTPDQLTHFLRVVGADRDPDGRFLIGGAVISGLGGLDVLVSPDAVYFIGGSPHGLALDLRGTSYGMAVTVI